MIKVVEAFDHEQGSRSRAILPDRCPTAPLRGHRRRLPDFGTAGAQLPGRGSGPDTRSSPSTGPPLPPGIPARAVSCCSPRWGHISGRHRPLRRRYRLRPARTARADLQHAERFHAGNYWPAWTAVRWTTPRVSPGSSNGSAVYRASQAPRLAWPSMARPCVGLVQPHQQEAEQFLNPQRMTGHRSMIQSSAP